MDGFEIESYLQQVSDSAGIEECPKVPVPSIGKNQNYLFISYSHKDYKEVYSDLAHLYVRGVRFWYDKGLSVGRDWEQEVEEHIRHPNCCGIIFYLSTNMFLSNSVLKEIEFTQKRKNGSIIFQKNYFCVNLHKGSISDVLFEAQSIQKQRGLPLLDTKAVNLLTSTFSDNDTYIDACSSLHVEELIDQIKRQFDVTEESDNSREPSPFDVQTSKEAMRVLLKGKFSIAAISKHIWTCFREKKLKRAWYMIPAAALAGIIAAAYGWYLMMTADAPFIQMLMEEYGRALFCWLGVFWCGALLPYGIFQLFWLFYLTPVYRKCERNPRLLAVHHAIFLLGVMVTALCIPLMYAVMLLMFHLLIGFFKTFDELIRM